MRSWFRKDSSDDQQFTAGDVEMASWAARDGNNNSDAVGSELGSAFNNWGLSTAGVPVNSLTALNSIPVLACVTVLSEDVAKLPLWMYRRLPKNKGKEVIHDDWLARLLKKPNAWQTRFEFMEMMQACLVLRSNAYAVIVRNDRGIPQQLVPIHPDRVTLFEAPGGEWFYAVSRQGLHEMAVLHDLPVLIANEDMLHARWLSQWNSLLGVSRVGLMREAIGLGMSQEAHSAGLMGKGARPSGVLHTDGKLSDTAISHLKQSFKDNFSGPRNAGAILIAEEGLNWDPLTMTMVDAEFMAGRLFQLEEVARGFRIPRHKVGLPVEGAATSMIAYEQMYLNDVISTWCERWVAKFQELGDLDGDEFFVEFDYSHFLKADIQTRIAAMKAGVTGMIFTPNEARSAEDLPAVEGGDTLYQPTNMAPIGFTPAAGGAGSGPGSDITGTPAPGGDGDPSATPPDDDTAPSD